MARSIRPPTSRASSIRWKAAISSRGGRSGVTAASSALRGSRARRISPRPPLCRILGSDPSRSGAAAPVVGTPQGRPCPRIFRAYNGFPSSRGQRGMSSPVPVIRTLAALRAQVKAWRGAGETVALVPTMGALHEGHLALVRLAKQHCRRAIASIFVNPTQFAPHEDFDRYPRNETGDLALLGQVGCDGVWAPGRADMYPEG